MVKNVIEFEIPWDKSSWNITLHGNQLQVSVFDKQMNIETPKQTIELKSTDNSKKDSKLKHEDSYLPPSRTSSGESRFRSHRDDDFLESINTRGPLNMRRQVPRGLYDFNRKIHEI